MSYIPTIEDIADTIALATKGEAPQLEHLRVPLEDNDGEPIVDGPPNKKNVYKLVAAVYALLAELDQASDVLKRGNNRGLVPFADNQRVQLRARMDALHNWLWKHGSAGGPRLVATFESLKGLRDECKSVLRTVRR